MRALWLSRSVGSTEYAANSHAGWGCAMGEGEYLSWLCMGGLLDQFRPGRWFWVYITYRLPRLWMNPSLTIPVFSALSWILYICFCYFTIYMCRCEVTSWSLCLRSLMPCIQCPEKPLKDDPWQVLYLYTKSVIRIIFIYLGFKLSEERLIGNDSYSKW